VRVEVCVCWAADVPQGLLQGALTLGAGIVVLGAAKKGSLGFKSGYPPFFPLTAPSHPAPVPSPYSHPFFLFSPSIPPSHAPPSSPLPFFPTLPFPPPHPSHPSLPFLPPHAPSSSISSATQDTVAHLARRLPTTTKAMLVSHVPSSHPSLPFLPALPTPQFLHLLSYPRNRHSARSSSPHHNQSHARLTWRLLPLQIRRALHRSQPLSLPSPPFRIACFPPLRPKHPFGCLCCFFCLIYPLPRFCLRP
ncbi:unnamed protein product, partial [Closterium sp. NIES-53]